MRLASSRGGNGLCTWRARRPGCRSGHSICSMVPSSRRVRRWWKSDEQTLRCLETFPSQEFSSRSSSRRRAVNFAWTKSASLAPAAGGPGARRCGGRDHRRSREGRGGPGRLARLTFAGAVMAASTGRMTADEHGKGTGWGDDSSLPLLTWPETALGCSLAPAAGFGLGGELVVSVHGGRLRRRRCGLVAANELPGGSS